MLNTVAMLVGYWAMLLSGVVILWFLLGAIIAANTRRWREDLKAKAPQAVEPECYMPVLKKRERITARRPSLKAEWVEAPNDSAIACKVLGHVSGEHDEWEDAK